MASASVNADAAVKLDENFIILSDAIH